MELSTGFNLNNATAHRQYRTSQSAIIDSLINKPVSISPGELILIWLPSVVTNKYGIQIIFATTGKTPQVFIRNFASSAGWGEWRIVTLTLV